MIGPRDRVSDLLALAGAEYCLSFVLGLLESADRLLDGIPQTRRTRRRLDTLHEKALFVRQGATGARAAIQRRLCERLKQRPERRK